MEATHCRAPTKVLSDLFVPHLGLGIVAPAAEIEPITYCPRNRASSKASVVSAAACYK